MIYFERNFFPFISLFQSLLLTARNHFLYRVLYLVSSVACLSPTVNTPPLFYLSNHWHHISIISSVCQVFELLLLIYGR